jgi:hypothetical protein
VAFLFSLVDVIRKNLNELYQDFIEKSSQDYGSIRKIQDGQAILLGYSWGGFPVRHIQDDGRSGYCSVVPVLKMTKKAFLDKEGLMCSGWPPLLSVPIIYRTPA